MSAASEQSAAKSPPQLTALIVLVFAEAAIVLAATGLLLVEAFSVDARERTTAIALAATTALFAVGMVVLGAGLARRWLRIRGGVLLCQLLLVACAIGGFEGLLGPTWLGWLLLAPAVAGIWLLFTKPVTAIFAAKDEARRT